MPTTAIGPLILFLFFLLTAAHLLGNLFARLRQPRVIGEICAGIILGPFALGRIPMYVRMLQLDVAAEPKKAALDFFYWLGLLLLMFISGAEAKSLFQPNERRPVVCLAALGTGLPFCAMMTGASFLQLRWFMGTRDNRISLVLVMSIAVAVTSIPVISRIFLDLKMLNTRFARVVLGVAVVEDIVLWAILAVATALACSSGLPDRKIVMYVAATLVYFAIGISLAPRAVKRISKSRFNRFANASPVPYALLIVLAYVAVAGVMQVNLIFAAFLAGFAISRKQQGPALENITRFSFALFIPVYFALVGYNLIFGKGFSPAMLLGFLAGSCLLKLVSVGLGARVAGYRGLSVLNLAVATNARGGPGIVLASVAYDAGIISPQFYTALVLVAVLTSQAAGAWLEFVLRRGWPLLDESIQPSAIGSQQSGIVQHSANSETAAGRSHLRLIQVPKSLQVDRAAITTKK